MPMPEKILDEKAAPVKPSEDLVSNQTAPASGMSNKLDEIVSETHRLSIEDKAQAVENTPAEVKESKGKLAQPVPDVQPVAEPETAKPKDAETAAETKPAEFSDSKKRTHEEISNNDLEMKQQAKLDEEADKQSKRLKVDDTTPVAVAEVPVESVVPVATATEPVSLEEKIPAVAVEEPATAKPSEPEAKPVAEGQIAQAEVQNPEPAVAETKPAAEEEKLATDSSPSVMKDIPASKMQQEAFATIEAAPETKTAEEPKISSTTELEKAYIADVNKESSKAPAEPGTDSKPELSEETAEKKD